MKIAISFFVCLFLACGLHAVTYWSVSPSSADLGMIAVGATSTEFHFTVFNPNRVQVGPIGFGKLSGGFRISRNFCVPTTSWNGKLGPNSYCDFYVVYSPTVPGPSTQSLSVIISGLSTKRVALKATTLITITTASLPQAICGKNYSVQIRAVGGYPPYSWSAVTGLPPGLSISRMGTLNGIIPCSAVAGKSMQQWYVLGLPLRVWDRKHEGTT